MTGRKVRHAKVAEIVSDCPRGCSNLFLSARLKVDAQSENLKALNSFPVLVGDLPGYHSCRVKAQSQILQFLSGFENDEAALVVLVIFLFVRRLSATIIPALALPVSRRRLQRSQRRGEPRTPDRRGDAPSGGAFCQGAIYGGGEVRRIGGIEEQ